jgi:hypothetical protein
MVEDAVSPDRFFRQRPSLPNQPALPLRQVFVGIWRSVGARLAN